MNRLAFVLACSAVAAPATCQNIAWSPSQLATAEGNSNNTIPFWSTSATYQQIHDYANMRAAMPVPLPITGIAWRKDAGGNAAVQGRTLDVQMVAATTTVRAANASMTFATNLGSNPVTVLPWTPVNLPTLSNVSTPNPAGWVVQWSTPYVYVPVPGMHLCWEWRHRNASTNVSAGMDASTGGDGKVLPNEGVGCVATGQTQPASVLRSALSLTRGVYLNHLGRGAGNAGAVFLLGLQRTSLQLPGMCAPLLHLPLFSVAGTTDQNGDWTMEITGLDLRDSARAQLLGQFVFLDGAHGLGVGLSDMSVIESPARELVQMVRLWAGPSRGGSGHETATNAIGLTQAYGLVTGFVTP